MSVLGYCLYILSLNPGRTTLVYLFERFLEASTLSASSPVLLQ